jgi:hypothetical protein
MLGALIGAGLNIAASAIGSAIANKRKREAEQKYQAGINEQIDELNNEINGNFLDRADARNALRKVTDANTETLRQLNTDAIRGGATDEAKVAMASKLNKQTADVVGDLAAIGEQRKDALKGQKRSLKLGLLQHQYAQDADTSGIDTIVQGVGAAANAIGSAWGTKNDMPTDTASADTTTDTTSADTAAAKVTYDPDRLKPQTPSIDTTPVAGDEWETYTAQDRINARMGGANSQYRNGK